MRTACPVPRPRHDAGQEDKEDAVPATSTGTSRAPEADLIEDPDPGHACTDDLAGLDRDDQIALVQATARAAGDDPGQPEVALAVALAVDLYTSW